MNLHLSLASLAEAPFACLLTKNNMHTYYKCYGITWADENFLKQWQTYENYVIYEAGNKVGFLSLSSDDLCLYIRDIQIFEPYFGKAIGTWAISKALTLAQNRKQHSIRLKVFENSPVKSLYERLGFLVAGTEKNLIRMELNTGNPYDTTCSNF